MSGAWRSPASASNYPQAERRPRFQKPQVQQPHSFPDPLQIHRSGRKVFKPQDDSARRKFNWRDLPRSVSIAVDHASLPPGNAGCPLLPVAPVRATPETRWKRPVSGGLRRPCRLAGFALEHAAVLVQQPHAEPRHLRAKHAALIVAGNRSGRRHSSYLLTCRSTCHGARAAPTIAMEKQGFQPFQPAIAAQKRALLALFRHYRRSSKPLERLDPGGAVRRAVLAVFVQ